MTRIYQITDFARENNFIDKSLENGTMWIISSKYYDSTTLFNVLLKSALNKTSVEDVTSRFCDLPSADTVLAQFAKTHHNKTIYTLEGQISHYLQSKVCHHEIFDKSNPAVATTLISISIPGHSAVS